MPFPVSISGRLEVPATIFAESCSAVARLREALLAQTVDAVSVEGIVLHFMPEAQGNARKPRPQGNAWMLAGLGRGRLAIEQDTAMVKVDYHIDTRLNFCLVTSISFLVGIAIHVFGEVDRQRGWVFAAGLWTVIFASSYASRAIEFRRWLRANLTSYSLPPTKPLRVPHDPA